MRSLVFLVLATNAEVLDKDQQQCLEVFEPFPVSYSVVMSEVHRADRVRGRWTRPPSLKSVCRGFMRTTRQQFWGARSFG